MKAHADNPEKLVAHLRELVAEAEDLVSGSSHSRSHLADLRARFANTQARLQEFYTHARDKVAGGARFADDTIRTHPYQAVLVGVSIGLLAGVLFRRGR